jgi:rhodanese-related sulfurtransferase/type 1 glutamine amidotransferase|tara:strand:+ start:9181 stop:10269 length:1089 start_codon:yes stop_codon:yes gene_type:complete
MKSLIRFILIVGLFWVVKLSAAPAKHHIVFLAGESLYGSEMTLSVYADNIKKKFGYQCTTLTRIDKDKFLNLDVLNQADLVVFYMRRMTLPAGQLGQVKRYIESGRPVIGLRTASHAMQNWLAFDKLVLGGNYQGHHKNELIGQTSIIPEMKSHPILNGVKSSFIMGGSLYKNTPLAKQATALITGKVKGHSVEPVAWTHTYKGNRSFYTSLGHQKDFENANFINLMTNAIEWCLNDSIKSGVTSVEIAGKYGIESGKPFRIGVGLFEKMWKEEKMQLLDVRTTSEFTASHIPGTKWIDWFSPNFAKEVAKLDKDKIYLVYCAGGVRSARACKKMSDMGFNYTVDLAPGFNGWKASGKPIEK